MSACELSVPRPDDPQRLMQAVLRRIGGIAALLLMLACISTVFASLP